MDLNWVQSFLYGFLSGLTDILPVSARAHRILLLKFFGNTGHTEAIDFLIRLGCFAALFFRCQPQLIKFSRAKALARVPKRKRKRPLDVRTMMDYSMFKTMLIPVVIGLLFYRQASTLVGNLVALSVCLFLNGIILYVPQFLPTSNRDSRTLSRVEGFLMGLGGTVSVLPGFSAIGVSTAIGSACGVERSYSLSMALLMNLGLTLGMLIWDAVALFSAGWGDLSVVIILRYLLAALSAFAGTALAIRLMRAIAANHGFTLFGLYCFGLSLFTFILNLMA